MLITTRPFPRPIGEQMFQLPRVATLADPLRLAVFISGSGSGMEALLRHQEEGECSHTTIVVISNVARVAGLARAKAHGVMSEVIEHSGQPGENADDRRQAHEKAIHALLVKLRIEAVILSGYMRILTPWFVELWEGRLINIHPSILPEFPGGHAHRDVLSAGAKVTGCTIHFVDTDMDSGRIIAQREVPVHKGDSEESLSERVKQVEHTLYPLVIDAFASGNLPL
jgi:formyltetrahydrofolate-dependent phosphoribosylglycinamide formyltransferase